VSYDSDSRPKFIEFRWREVDEVSWLRYKKFPVDASPGTYLLDGLKRGVTYVIEARTIARSGNASSWVQISHTVGSTVAPAAPGSLVGIGVADGVYLTWNVSGLLPGSVDFVVDRAPDVAGSPGTYAMVGQTRALNFTDGVTDGGLYWYRVKAVDFYGQASVYATAVQVKAKEVADGADVSGQVSPITILNPYFEAGDRDWLKGSGWAIVNAPSDAMSGSWLAKKTFDVDSLLESETLTPVSQEQQVTVRAYVKGVSPTGNVKVGIAWYTSAMVLVSLVESAPVTSAPSWTAVQMQSKAPATAALARFYVRVSGYSTGEWWVDATSMVLDTGQVVVPFGGVWANGMYLNYQGDETPNAGEIGYGGAGTFVNAAGTSYTVPATAYTVTPFEGSGQAGMEAYVLFVGSDQTRFPALALSDQKWFVAAQHMNGQWFYSDDSSLPFAHQFTPNSNDCIIARVVGDASGLALLAKYASTTVMVVGVTTIGGGNLVKNSSFDADSDGDGTADHWAGYVGILGGTTGLSLDVPYGDGKSQYGQVDGTTLAPRFHQHEERPYVPASKRLTFSAYVKAPVGRTVYLNVKVFSAASGGSELEQFGTTSWSSTGAWQRQWITFTTTQSGYLNCLVGLHNTPAAGTVFYVDKVQLELGDVATAWAPRGDELLPGSVQEEHIATGAVTTAKFGDAVMTSDKLAVVPNANLWPNGTSEAAPPDGALYVGWDDAGVSTMLSEFSYRYLADVGAYAGANVRALKVKDVSGLRMLEHAVPAMEGEYYAAWAYVKMPTYTSGLGANLYLTFRDSVGSIIGATYSSSYQTGSTWTKLSAVAGPAPAGTVTVRLTLACTAATNDVAWFDQVTLRKMLVTDELVAGAVTTAKLDVLARNLVDNFSNSQSLSNWWKSIVDGEIESAIRLSGTGTPVAPQKAGVNVYVLHTRTNSSSTGIQWSSAMFDVDPNQDYQFNVSWYKESALGSVYIGLYVYNDAGTLLSVDVAASADSVWGGPSNNAYWHYGGDVAGVWRDGKFFLSGCNTRVEDARRAYVTQSTSLNESNNSSRIRMPPNAKYVRVRVLNFYPGGVARSIWFHAPQVFQMGEGVVRANSVEAVHIKAKNVSIDKLTVGNIDNLWPNPTSEESPPTGADLAGSEFGARYNAGASAYAGSWVRSLYADPGGTNALYHTVPCSPADSFYLEAYTKTLNGGGGIDGGAVVLQYLNASGGVLQTSYSSIIVTLDSWLKVSVEAVAPAGAQYVKFGLYVISDSEYEPVTQWFDAIYARRMVDNAVVVAGTLTIDRIATGQLKTSNYAEDANLNPTAGVKLDHTGTALKVAPKNLQVYQHNLEQMFAIMAASNWQRVAITAGTYGSAGCVGRYLLVAGVSIVRRSSDLGWTWSSVDTTTGSWNLGSDGMTYVAAVNPGTTTTIRRSSNAGASFAAPTTGGSQTGYFRKVIHVGANTFVGVDETATSQRCLRSTDDGANWTQANVLPSGRWTDLAYATTIGANGRIVAIQAGSGATTYATSDDRGATWTSRTLPVEAYRITWNSGLGKFIAVLPSVVTYNGGSWYPTTRYVLYSSDGISWSYYDASSMFPDPTQIGDLVSGGPVTVCSVYGIGTSRVLLTVNSVDWRLVETGVGAVMRGMSFVSAQSPAVGGIFFGVTNEGVVGLSLLMDPY
jgi:hypothetical protein